MKHLFYKISILMLPVLQGCNTSTRHADIKTALPKPGFSNKTYKLELTPGCDSCPHATVHIPVAEGSTTIAKSINDSVFAVAQQTLGEEGKLYANYDSLLAGFMNAYKKMKADLHDDAPAGWEGEINGSITIQTNSFINIKLETFTFTGGAHPNANTYSLLFNAATGKQLAEADIVKDIPGLTAVAEKKFREQLKIPASTPLNSSVYTFDDNKFVLPKNIFFTEGGLQLLYNAYEIAPYYVGPTILTLPYADTQPYLALKP
ncbi:DUF3298 domain-containing protein [Parafilimonas sp.]|uniref:DUF3298 and DUF4163 domain-containing protein n=1 Tax=Parafilimonas sp. TaxID=1969739 RepID=UPI0039E358DC